MKIEFVAKEAFVGWHREYGVMNRITKRQAREIWRAARLLENEDGGSAKDYVYIATVTEGFTRGESEDMENQSRIKLTFPDKKSYISKRIR